VTVCPNCATECQPTQKFCGECGGALAQPPASEQLENGSGLVAAPQSRTEAPTCSVCGSPLEDGGNFCFECGSATASGGELYKPEQTPITTPKEANESQNSDAAAGLLGALWGGSASCGCGCFSLVALVGLLAIVGAFL
jgi:hypothetical protein